MPNFVSVDATARAKLKPGPQRKDRQPYRDMLTSLSSGQVIEVVPSAGETLRAAKVNLSRAAKEVGVAATYGETRDGALLVWLAEPKRRRKRE